MIEKFSSQNKEIKMEKGSIEELTEQVREFLIKEFQKAIKIYGPDWIRKESIQQLIEDLENKRPVRLGDPFTGDYLDAALYSLGIRPDPDHEKYTAIWKRLEQGNKDNTGNNTKS